MSSTWKKVLKVVQGQLEAVWWTFCLSQGVLSSSSVTAVASYKPTHCDWHGVALLEVFRSAYDRWKMPSCDPTSILAARTHERMRHRSYNLRKFVHDACTAGLLAFADRSCLITADQIWSAAKYTSELYRACTGYPFTEVNVPESSFDVFSFLFKFSFLCVFYSLSFSRRKTIQLSSTTFQPLAFCFFFFFFFFFFFRVDLVNSLVLVQIF